MPVYKLKQGDCIESIAFEHGFFWETIWEHPDNSAVKRERKDPFVLMPGDQIIIPEIQCKEENGATENRHRFRRKGVPALFQITILDQDEPCADTSYVLKIDGKSFPGVTDSEGKICQRIPPNARLAELIIGEGEDQMEYSIDLGYLDPVTELTGIQSRLSNLGYYEGEIDDNFGAETRSALRMFQQSQGLGVTGEIDQQTQDELKNIHGS